MIAAVSERIVITPDPVFNKAYFDELYTAEIDPWEQSGTLGVRADYYNYSRRKLMRRLSGRLTAEACGLEIGCGHGYVTEMLSKAFNMTGLDISEVALKRARQMQAGIEFVQGDITNIDFAMPDSYHFVVLPQCWWYIVDKLRIAINNCIQCLEPNGLLVMSQAFPKKDFAEDDETFDWALDSLRAFPSLQLVECHYDDTGLLAYHDGLIIMRKIDGEGGASTTKRHLRVARRT